MAVRTIDAPGIEIHEIDKSQYSPAMTGTKVLVTGFANSGEDYIPMIFTSKSAWLKYYGEPNNEAERYFYTASMEVLNQNGVVNCCKLPYENAAKDKFVAMKYKLNTTQQTIKTVGEALDSDLSSIKTALETSKDYNTDVLKFFVENVNITDVVDKETLTSSDTIPYTVLSNNVNTVNRSDGRTDTANKNFFETYDVGVLSSISAVTSTYNSQMNKSDLIRYVDKITENVGGLNPKFKMFYSISSDTVDGDSPKCRQTIKLFAAKDSSANYILLTAENTVDLSDTIHQIEDIDGLMEFDYSTPSDPTDDIFATFTGYGVSQMDVESAGELDVLHTNGYIGFRLTVADEQMTTESKEAACKYILKNIKDHNFTLVKVEPENIDKTVEDYSTYLQVNQEAIADARIDHILDVLKWSEIKDVDSTVDKMWSITEAGTPYEMSMDKIDEYRTDESRVGINEIVVVDKTRKGYTKIPEDKNHKDVQKTSDGIDYTNCEMIGIIPIITTAANAL